MRKAIFVFRREFELYFNSLIAYIFIILFLIISSILFFRTFFLYGQLEMRSFFELMPWFFLFFVPAITMRLWAEEMKLGTDEIVLTLPLSEWELVVGKFIASFTFLLLAIVLTISIPITLMFLGKPDMGPIIGGYLGLLFLGGAYLSIGLFASTLTENQIIALIIGMVISFVLFLIGQDFFLMVMPASIASVISYIGLSYHFESISRGVVDLRNIVYYLSILVFFITLAVYSVKSKKYQ